MTYTVDTSLSDRININNATLHRADCITALLDIRADAIITSPPYGLGKELETRS